MHCLSIRVQLGGGISAQIGRQIVHNDRAIALVVDQLHVGKEMVLELEDEAHVVDSGSNIRPIL